MGWVDKNVETLKSLPVRLVVLHMAGKALGGMGIAFLIAHFTKSDALLTWAVICLIASLVVSLPSGRRILGARRAERTGQSREDANHD